jgi:hypothetical protein
MKMDSAGSSVKPANIYQDSCFHNPENRNSDAYTSVDFLMKQACRTDSTLFVTIHKTMKTKGEE